MILDGKIIPCDRCKEPAISVKGEVIDLWYRELDINTRSRNALQRSLRWLGERGFALLNQRWRTLQHITASPSKIADIARAALVLTHFEHGYIS